MLIKKALSFLITLKPRFQSVLYAAVGLGLIVGIVQPSATRETIDQNAGRFFSGWLPSKYR